MCEKICIEQKRTKLLFSSHVSDHFWRTVSGGGPYNAENATFGPKPPLFRFGGVLPAVPCVLRRKFPLSLRFREVLLGNVATRGRIRPPATNSLETAKRNVFGLGWGFRCKISPNFAGKMAGTS